MNAGSHGPVNAQLGAVGPVGIEPTTRGLKDCRNGIRGRSPPYGTAGQRREPDSTNRPGRPWTTATGTQIGTKPPPTASPEGRSIYMRANDDRTPADQQHPTNGRTTSGWCSRKAHHRCIGAYEVPCRCACHATTH